MTEIRIDEMHSMPIASSVSDWMTFMEHYLADTPPNIDTDLLFTRVMATILNATPHPEAAVSRAGRVLTAYRKVAPFYD